MHGQAAPWPKRRHQASWPDVQPTKKAARRRISTSDVSAMVRRPIPNQPSDISVSCKVHDFAGQLWNSAVLVKSFRQNPRVADQDRGVLVTFKIVPWYAGADFLTYPTDSYLISQWLVHRLQITLVYNFHLFQDLGLHPKFFSQVLSLCV